MSTMSLKDAFVDPEERVFDPTKLPESVLERLPEPTGWRMLVIPFMAEKKSKGGIALTAQTVDRESLATVVCAVIKQGPLCYNDPDKYGPQPWCKVGDWVLIGRYAGSRFKLEDGEEVRIINDDEVNATILEPTDIRTYL